MTFAGSRLVHVYTISCYVFMVLRRCGMSRLHGASKRNYPTERVSQECFSIKLIVRQKKPYSCHFSLVTLASYFHKKILYKYSQSAIKGSLSGTRNGWSLRSTFRYNNLFQVALYVKRTSVDSSSIACPVGSPSTTLFCFGPNNNDSAEGFTVTLFLYTANGSEYYHPPSIESTSNLGYHFRFLICLVDEKLYGNMFAMSHYWFFLTEHIFLFLVVIRSTSTQFLAEPKDCKY